MTFIKKVTLSALAISMLTASLGGLPLSQKGLSQKLGFIQAANAAETELPSSVFLERMKGLYAALAAGDPTDMQEVSNFRDEIAGLDEAANQTLIDPIWNKISAKLPETVDQAELKASLFRLIKAVGSFRYDPEASDLEAIRTNPEYRATLKTIAAAGGDENIKLEDFLVFMFGDGSSRKGVEGTVGSLLADKSPLELIQLLINKQGITTVMLQATEKLLGETEAYKFSSIMKNLGVTPQDVRTTVLNFQLKLKKDEPAISAMTVAYIRSAATSNVDITGDGRVQTYSLNVFGVSIIPVVLQWSKVSGDTSVNVSPTGVVTIPDDTESGTAVIQAKLANPYGGAAKVIFEKEVTLTATDGDHFPAELFIERMNKLYAALLAGDPADVQDVRDLRDEFAKLDFAADQALIDPVWNKIAPNLPASVNQAELKKSLFQIIQAVGSFQYDPEGKALEAIRTNPEFRAALKTIAAAGGVKTLKMDDFLLLLFGDGDIRPGIEGTVRDIIADMKPKELIQLLGNNDKFNTVLAEATAGILSEKDDYALSEVLNNLGVEPTDVLSVVLGFQVQLQHEEQAINALTVAYIRSEVVPSVKVTADGRQHEYKLSLFDTELSTSFVKWKKVSGSEDVTVDSKGKVKIPKEVAEGTAVIQATLINPNGGSSKVIFEQEVTLVNGNVEIDPKVELQKIAQALEIKLADIKTKLKAATDDEQKVLLILEVVQAKNEAVNQINAVEASNALKKKAISGTKSKVSKVLSIIIKDIMSS